MRIYYRMRITISTPVKQSVEQVWEGFDEKLFLQLSPPFPPVRLLRFDGCRQGDIVRIELNFFLFHQVWESTIIDHAIGPDESYFIDEASQLPFFLKYWHHRHRIVKQGDDTVIIDDIHFRTPTRITDFLFYPILYGQFLYRKPIYRKVFGC